MKIHVKVLLGEEHIVDVLPTETILELKNKINGLLDIDVTQQTLLLTGKPLADENQISFYPGIKEGSKLTLVKKSCQSTQNTKGIQKFRDEMLIVLRQYYSESEAQSIANETIKLLKNKVQLLNLEDLERLATAIIQDQENTS